MSDSSNAADDSFAPRLRPVPALGTVAYASGIWYLSSQSGLTSGGQWSGVFANLLHLPLFGGLALIAALSFEGARGRTLRALWAAVVLYGVADELHQATVPGRHADPLDVAVDALGAGACLVLWWGAGRGDLRPALLRFAGIGTVGLLVATVGALR